MTDPTPAPVEGFAALGLNEILVETLSALSYETPTPVQKQAIPVLLEGRDMLASAATGTGKTAAFTLPALQGVKAGAGPVQMLVLCPTRELALQVARAVKAYGKGLGIRVLPVFGGQSIGHQFRGLTRGVDVVVGTPGRVLDHLERGSLKLGDARRVVLDEADEMLDMGFVEDIEAILAHTPEDRQTALFSATFPPRIEALARAHLRDPVRLAVQAPAEETPKVRQVAYLVQRRYKVAALDRLLDLEDPRAAIIFCRTRVEVDELTEELALRGYRPRALHGGLSQAQRDRVMGVFRNGGAELLIATDVAARGLDVDHVSHVFNFDIPESPATYVHRIGRTGRAGREGTAMTLVQPRERRQLSNIERVAKVEIERCYLPTLDDLAERQRTRLQDQLLEVVAEPVDDGIKTRLDALVAEGHDPLVLAGAALTLAARATGRDQAPEEIPEWRPPPPRAPRPRPEGGSRRPTRQAPEGRARLFITAGKIDGIRPGDLVGAIANQANLSGSDIGPIRMDQRYCKVEVPADAADRVIEALRTSGLKGRRVRVDYDRQR